MASAVMSGVMRERELVLTLSGLLAVYSEERSVSSLDWCFDRRTIDSYFRRVSCLQCTQQSHGLTVQCTQLQTAKQTFPRVVMFGVATVPAASRDLIAIVESPDVLMWLIHVVTANPDKVNTAAVSFVVGDKFSSYTA